MKIIAINRDIGDARRQRVLNFFGNKAEIFVVQAKIKGIKKIVNLIRTFCSNKDIWRERSKKNEYFFKAISKNIGINIKNKFSNNYDVILLHEALYSPGLGDNLCKPYIVYEDSTAILAQRYWPSWIPDTALTKEYRDLVKSYYRNAASIITSNELTRKSLIEDYGVAPKNVITVGQGCKFSYSDVSRNDVNEKQILFVGYEFKRKGGDVLLKAFEIVRNKVPDANLVIVGPSLSIKQDGVTVLGQIRDRAKLMGIYKKSFIFVLPSYFDPMPNTIIEAMGGKLAVVTTDGCGSAEIIEDGVGGFIVPVGDSDALADRLIQLLGNSVLAKNMGKVGYDIVNARFRWEIVSNKVFEIIKSVL